MTNKLGLYNGALRLLKQRALATISDGVEARLLLDAVYDETLAWCLESGNWNAASVSVAIEASDDIEPSFGFGCAVEKPDDWVRTIGIAANGEFSPPLSAGEYLDEGAYWSCNCDPLYVRYVSSDTQAGLDMSLWLPSFIKFVQHQLAFEIGPHIGNLSEAALDRLERERDRAMRDARSKNSSNGPPMRPPTGRLVRSRGSRIFTRVDRRR